MARHAARHVEVLETPSPYAEELLDVDDVLEAVGRGFTGDELLEYLGEVAGGRYFAASREMPHRPTHRLSHGQVSKDRPATPVRDPFEGEIGATRYWSLSGRFREGEPAARCCLFADSDLFLTQVDDLAKPGG